jgi:hypothetical protein
LLYIEVEVRERCVIESGYKSAVMTEKPLLHDKRRETHTKFERPSDPKTFYLSISLSINALTKACLYVTLVLPKLAHCYASSDPRLVLLTIPESGG